MASTTIEEPVAAIVTTDKCFIRAYHVSDAAAASAAGNHPDISYYMRNTFPYPYTLDNANSWIKHVNEGNPVTNFAIYLLDGTFVGGIGLNPG